MAAAPQDKRPITAEDVYNLADIEEPRVSPDGRWIAYVHTTVDKVQNEYKRHIWLAPTDGGAPVQLTRGGADSSPRWSPDGAMLAFVSKRDEKPQVYVIAVSAPGGEARALTKAPNGASAPAWSPDGTHIAYLAKMDARERAKEDSGEEEPPAADKFEAEQRAAREKYEEEQRHDARVVRKIPYRAGTTYHDGRYNQVYVIPVAEGLKGDAAKPRRLTDIDADHDPPQWTPDGAYLLTGRTVDPERDEPWRHSSLYRIRVADGEIEQLTDESHTDYRPLPSPDGQWIAYERYPAAAMSLYIARLTVIPAAGGAPRDLNLAFDRSLADVRWTADSRALVFSAPNAGRVEVFKVAPEGGAVEPVVTGDYYTLGIDVGPEGGVAFAAGTPASPPELFWQAPGAAAPQQLTEANRAWLDTVIVQPTHEIRFTAPDGKEIQGWYLLPVGYEEGKTYPLAFNVHGGPHAMYGPGQRGIWHEWQVHAARGYVAFYTNPRGSDGYGETFLQGGDGRWGEADMPDLMAGIDAIIAKGFVDPARMAVTGGSYGGFMTAWLIGHTDRFAAAVSQRGVYNMFSMYGTTDIPTFNADELGGPLPWEDPERYWKYSPLAYAHQIKTPLLILHSENDFRVPIPEGEQLFAYIRRSGGTVEMVRFPREGHELSRSGEPKHRAERLNRMVAWFDRYCKPGQE
ncbi:MAG: S9 family peptidase [Anaerolineae bacterium]|nr:S9 family peptidase [Anaerolineae bacterium]